MLPAVVLVRDDLAGGIGGGTHLADMRGAIVIPTVLIPPHELQADWLSRTLRKYCRCLRHIVVAAVAVSARSFVILDAHFVRRDSEHDGQLAARPVHILR